MLKGQTALITGANGGIGKSILDLFLKNNANVICLIRKSDNKFKNYVKKFSKRIQIIEADLTNESQLKEKIEKIFSTKNKLDLLINNAGKASGSTIEMTSQKNLKEIFDVNFFSQIRLTQLLLKYLKKSKRASIINIGSVVTKTADKGTLSYGCSKTALMHATKIMANEFSSYKIRVNGICPNVTKTNMMKKMEINAKNSLISKSYIKRPLLPSEVAKSVLFLCSENSHYINGQILRLDGGMSNWKDLAKPKY